MAIIAIEGVDQKLFKGPCFGWQERVLGCFAADLEQLRGRRTEGNDTGKEWTKARRRKWRGTRAGEKTARNVKVLT